MEVSISNGSSFPYGSQIKIPKIKVEKNVLKGPYLFYTSASNFVMMFFYEQVIE